MFTVSFPEISPRILFGNKTTLKCLSIGTPRLISVEDVRNYLSHIIYILIFDFFLNFLLFVRLQIPTSSTDQLWLFDT